MRALLRQFGLYATALSATWMLWIAMFLPMLDRTFEESCMELQKVTQIVGQDFGSQCIQTMGGNELATVAIRILVVTCAILIIVSIAMWIRKKRLVDKIK
jgi:hypothetical protein